MDYRKLRSIMLAMVMSFVGVFYLFGVLDVSSILAQEITNTTPKGLEPSVQPLPSDGDFIITVYFTDPASIVPITDLTGNMIGDGQIDGRVRCVRDNCGQKTNLTVFVPLTDYSYFEYKYTTRQAYDPIARRLVVEGRGIITSGDQKERFLFIASIEDNQDGTLRVRLDTSIPQYSLIIPSIGGSIHLGRG